MRIEKHIILFVIPFLLCLGLFSQECKKVKVYYDHDFKHTRIDTAFSGGEIERIRFININDSTEYYNLYVNNGTTEIGYLKNGLPYRCWETIGSEGSILNSLDFDTLKVQYKDILRIADEKGLSLDSYEIDFYYDYYSEYDFGFGKEYINHWIVSRDTSGYCWSEVDGIAVDAVTGRIWPYGLEINEQPAYDSFSRKSLAAEKGLVDYFKKKSKYPISPTPKNQVWVWFTITCNGKIEDVNTGRANTGYFLREADRLVRNIPKRIIKQYGSDNSDRHFTVAVDFE